MTVFPKPEWNLKASDKEVWYAYVRNIVYIAPTHGAEKKAYIIVPSELFILADTILSQKQLAMVKEHFMCFYLDQIDDKHWIFGLDLAGQEIIDLWIYTKSALPAWAELAINRK